jgi:hypothetical protein
MLSKKSTTEPVAPKGGILKTNNKKKKTEATFEFSRFQDEIRVQAYYNYLKRIKNNNPGDQMGDWLEAEKSVRMSLSTH